MQHILAGLTFPFSSRKMKVGGTAGEQVSLQHKVLEDNGSGRQNTRNACHHTVDLPSAAHSLPAAGL